MEQGIKSKCRAFFQVKPEVHQGTACSPERKAKGFSGFNRMLTDCSDSKEVTNSL